MAVTTDKLHEDAALVVDTCLSVEDGDVVTIICDDEHAGRGAGRGRGGGRAGRRGPWS